MVTAALDLYGRRGWDALSVAGVARQAGLGKSSAYLRWPSKAELLAYALDRQGTHVQDVDTGTVRTDLVAMGLSLYSVFDGPAGAANLRLQIDALLVPELRTVEARMRDSQVAAARQIVRRGIDRGEIPATTPIGVVLSAVCGGVVNYVASRGSAVPRAARDADAQRFCERLVDLVLGGIAA